jgi:aspartyl-tRNA(Asn)/glutamyl-tRNA(Gln) amidotransferase subunit A
VPGKLKIGYYKHCLEHPGMDPEVREHTNGWVERLRAEGHTLEALELPMADLFVPTYYILSTAEASSNLARFDGVRYGHRSKEAVGVEQTYEKSRSEGLGPEVQRRILLGTFVLSAGYYDAYYAQGMRVRRLIRDNTLASLNRLDAVLTPTCPTTAFSHGQISDPVAMYLQDIFTVQANLVGIPAVSLPTGHHSNGLPFGIQLMAKPFDDERLLAVAGQLFRA